jgi:SSS family solute:Na+ symporter
LLGWLFVPHYLQSRVFTMPEFLERRFSANCRWYLTGVSIFAYIFTKISVALFAGGILIREVFGWDYMTTAVLLVLATGVYTIAGGLAAVIYTDLAQSFILIGGAVLLTLLGLGKAGGFEGMRAALPPDFFHMIKPIGDPVYPWLGTTVGTVILGIWYWCTDQVIVQKTLSARSVPQARKGAFFCASLKILPVFILVLPGLIAKTLWPQDVTGDNAYPLLVMRLLPAGLTGLMVAALLAALMSSLSSVFNSCSTLITMDVYKKLRPEASERRLVLVGRLTTAAIVALSIAWIPFIRYLNSEIYQYLQSVQAYVGAPITATFLTGILWRGATARAAFTTLVFGGVLGALRFLLDILHNALGYDLGMLNTVVAFSFLNFAVMIFFVCVGLMVLLSRFGEKPELRRIAGLTLDWSRRAQRSGIAAEAAFTGVVGGAIVMLWYHFR